MQREDEGMAIIQSAVNADITGQVGMRIWQDANPYKNLWVDPTLLELDTEEGSIAFRENDLRLGPDIPRVHL